MLRTLTMRRGLTMVRRAHSIKRVGLRTQFLKRTPKQFGGVLLFGPLLMSKDAPELQHHEIHKFTPTVKVQSMQEVHQNIFKRFYNFIRLCLRAIGIVIAGSALITSGLVVHYFPLMPNFTRRLWRSLLVRSLGFFGACSTKLGQWAATRPDLFSDEICDALSHLHTRAPMHSYRHTEKIFNAVYGCSIDKVFEDFDKEPIASGAIAQVYRATYCKNEGEKEEVVIKVRHPYVVDNIAMDLSILRSFACFLEMIPGVKWMSVKKNIESFAVTMDNQLNLYNEGKNLETFNENFKEYHHICFPKPYLEVSNEDVLVESFEHGIQVKEFFKGGNINSSPAFKKELASLGFNAFLKMVFLDNCVHGDLHPGNVLIRESKTKGGKPEVVFLDAGLVVKLTDHDRKNFIDLFSAVAAGNGKLGAQLMIERSQAEIPTAELQEKFRVEMSELFEEVTSQALKDIAIASAFMKVMRLCRQCQVQIDGSFSSLMTGLIVVEGLARALNADFDLMKEAKPLLRKDRQFVMSYLKNRL